MFVGLLTVFACLVLFRASLEGRTGVSSHTGKGCHFRWHRRKLWPGSEAGNGVHVATYLKLLQVVFAAVVVSVGVAAILFPKHVDSRLSFFRSFSLR